MKKRISIVLVDDDRQPREAMVNLILAERGFRVQLISAELRALTRAIRETRPDLVLLNLPRKGKGRLTFAVALHQIVPALPVVIMGLAPRRDDVVGLVRAGVAGFIMANASFDVHRSTVLQVARGNRILPPDLTNVLFVQLRRRHRAPQAPSVLPPVRLSILQARS